MSTLRLKRRLGMVFLKPCPDATAYGLEFITPSSCCHRWRVAYRSPWLGGSYETHRGSLRPHAKRHLGRARSTRAPLAPRVSLADCIPRAGAGCARTPPLQVIRLGCEDLDIGPELLESCGDHLPVYGRLVSYKGPHASRAGILAPSARGYVEALRHMVVYARPIALHYADRRDASPLKFRIDPHGSSARWPGGSGTDQDCHSIVTTPWRTAKTSACSLEETSSLERMLVTWEWTVPSPTWRRRAISLS